MRQSTSRLTAAVCTIQLLADHLPRAGAWAARALAVVGLLIGVGCERQGANQAASKQAATATTGAINVVLITLDTTRADHLGCYGHPEMPTPNIDRLAADGCLFTQCATVTPLTLPAHASIMTGLYPFVHGVRDNGRFRLPQRFDTLAELLRDATYVTGAQVAAFVLNRPFGLDQGFVTFQDVPTTPTRESEDHLFHPGQERIAREVGDRTLEWLGAHAGEKFFLWVHFFDPHGPYEPPKRFNTYSDKYVGEIAYADEQVGRLLGALVELKIDNRTLVVLTSDHGESRGQHGEGTHSYFVYDATMRVPLILRLPGVVPAGRRVAVQTSVVDIAPTVLEVLDLPVPKSMQGRSLLPLARGEPSERRVAYAESFAGFLALGTAPLRVLRTDEWKYVHAPRPELYRISDDQHEHTNLADREPERLRSLADELRAMLDAAPRTPYAAPAKTVSPDEARRLVALGYTGADHESGARLLADVDRFAPVGADPKDHVDDFVALNEADTLLFTRQFDQAEAVVRRLIESLGRRPQLLERLGKALAGRQRHQETIALYEELLAVVPGSAGTHTNLAVALAAVGRLDEALEHYVEAERIGPVTAVLALNHANALARAERWDEALQHYHAALVIDPTVPQAYFGRAAAAFKQQKLQDAVDAYLAGLELDPGNAEAHNNLGAIMGMAGKPDVALEQFELALQYDPNRADSHINLAILLAKTDPGRAIEHLRTSVGLAPDHGPAHLLLAQLLEQSDQPADAAKHYAAAAHILPNNADAQAGVKRTAPVPAED